MPLYEKEIGDKLIDLLPVVIHGHQRVEMNHKIKEKMLEFSRRVDHKLDTSIGTKHSISPLYILPISFELACKENGHRPNRSEIIQTCKGDKNEYSKSFYIIKNLLGLKDIISLQRCAIQLGIPQLAQKGNLIFNMYKKWMIENSHGSTRDLLDDPGLFAASLLIAAKDEQSEILLPEAERIVDISRENLKSKMQHIKQILDKNNPMNEENKEEEGTTRSSSPAFNLNTLSRPNRLSRVGKKKTALGIQNKEYETPTISLTNLFTSSERKRKRLNSNDTLISPQLSLSNKKKKKQKKVVDKAETNDVIIENLFEVNDMKELNNSDKNERVINNDNFIPNENNHLPLESIDFNNFSFEFGNYFKWKKHILNTFKGI